MKYLLLASSFVYWCSIWIYGILTFGAAFLLFLPGYFPNLYGPQVLENSAGDTVILSVMILAFASLAFVNYFAAKQNIVAIFISNSGFLLGLLLLGTGIWWYLLFSLTLPVVFVIMRDIFQNRKHVTSL